jgi:Domain of unknown function (DUF4340)
MSRGNQILAALLVVQIAVAALVLWPREAAVAGGEPLLAGIEADQVVRVTISDLVDGQIQLAKVQGAWVLSGTGDYPCQEDAVPDLLDKLLAIDASRLVSEQETSHKRLRVSAEDPMRKIELVQADNTFQTLYVGTSPSYSVSHVRLDGQDQVYLASGLSSSDAAVSAASWIDTLYLQVEQDQVTAITLENTNGRFVFTKDEAGTWTMDGLQAEETLDESAVSGLLGRISSLRMLVPLGKEEKSDYGMDAPGAVVTVRAGGETTVLTIGAQGGEDNAYAAKSSASPYYVRMAEYAAGDWVDKTRDDFLTLPPTPEPAS